MQRELAELIHNELKDPRVGMVTVSAVEVSRDLGHAKVFVTRFAPPEQVAESVAALTHAAGFLRKMLGSRMKLRSVPQLHFVHDESIERGGRLSALIDEAVAEDEHKHDNGGDQSGH